MAWKGPFAVLERRNRVNYIINNDGVPKQLHANLLKKYYRRANVNFVHIADSTGTDYFPIRADPLFNCQTCVVDNDSFPEIVAEPDEVSILPPTVTDDAESVETYSLCPNLDSKQIKLLSAVFDKFEHIMTPLSGCSDTIEYDIELLTSELVGAKFYQVPVKLREYFDKEVDVLLELKIIQPSRSHCYSPVVMVRKSDGSYRVTIDYRALNSVTKFQAEPPCLIEEDLHQFADAQYFSELDLSRAYYQIKLSEITRQYTAFPTRHGLMEFVRLPSGLVNACFACAQLMRIVLRDL